MKDKKTNIQDEDFFLLEVLFGYSLNIGLSSPAIVKDILELCR